MKKILIGTAFLACLTILSGAQNQSAIAAQTSSGTAREGVLLLAHGGSAQTWNEEVLRVAAKVD